MITVVIIPVTFHPYITSSITILNTLGVGLIWGRDNMEET